MELVPEGKNFRLAHEDEYPEILDFLSQHLPESLKFHQTLKTFIDDKVWEFFFYVTKSWPNDPVCLHFPGMTSTPNGRLYESFSVFCPNDNLELLEKLTDEDILIDWSKPIFLNFTHSDIMVWLEQRYSPLGIMDKVHGDIYVCENPPENLPLDVLPLREAEMLQLKPEHAKPIHDLYPANDMEAIQVFEKLIHRLPAYGIFSSTGELAAWMVQSYYGAMFSMQTRPEFRRKGYGIHLAQYLSKVVVDRGYVPFVVIRPENDASLSLYTKLGFQKSYSTIRAILKPHGYDEEVNEEQLVDISDGLIVPEEVIAVAAAIADETAEKEKSNSNEEEDEVEKSSLVNEENEENESSENNETNDQ